MSLNELFNELDTKQYLWPNQRNTRNVNRSIDILRSSMMCSEYGHELLPDQLTESMEDCC